MNPDFLLVQLNPAFEPGDSIDDRQAASLQAGHFNDFVEIGLLRAALYKATTYNLPPNP